MTVRYCSQCGHGNSLRGGLGFCEQCGVPLLASGYGRFEVRSVLGRGSVGVVVLAFDSVLERQVALRILSANVVADAEQLSSLEHAVQVMSGKSHTNWVEVYDLVRERGDVAVIMEFIDGASLGSVIDYQGVLAPKACAAGLAGALDGVAYLHELGMVHGDLKPTNVLLDRDGESKVGDVGVTADLDAGSVALGYLAPEQLRGEAPTAAADVFALGSLVFTMATGRAPFPTSDLASSLFAREHLVDIAGLHPVIADIVALCLAPDPDRRPQSTAEVRSLLDQAASQEFGSNWRAAGKALLASTVVGALGAAVAGAVGSAAGASAAAGTAGVTGAAGVTGLAATGSAVVAGSTTVAGGTAAVATGATVTAAGSAAASTAATSASTGLLAALAAKPVLVAAVAVGTIAVGGTGAVVIEKKLNSNPPATVASSGVAVQWEMVDGVPTQAAVIGPAGVSFMSISTGFATTGTDPSGDSRSSVSCAVAAAGSVYCWGTGMTGMLGNGAKGTVAPQSAKPIQGVLSGVKITSVAVGQDRVCALSDAGSAYCWGSVDGANRSKPVGSYLGGQGAAASDVPVLVAGQAQFVQLAVGGSDTCAVDDAANLWCWGLNETGTAQPGSVKPVAAPRQVAGIAGSNVSFVSVADGACALAKDNSAYCWGGMTEGPNPLPVRLQDGTGPTSGQQFTTISTAGSCVVGTPLGVGCKGNFTTPGPVPYGDQPEASPTFEKVTGPWGTGNVELLSTSWRGACVVAAGVTYCWGGARVGEGYSVTQPTALPLGSLHVAKWLSISVSGTTGTAIVELESRQSPPASAAAAGWTADPSFANGTMPAVLPQQCYSDSRGPVPLQLSNGNAQIPGTNYGQFALIGTPLFGTFADGGKPYTAVAYTCIGDGTYRFAEIVILDNSGKEVSTSPASTLDALAELSHRTNPGKSISAGSEFTFAARGAELAMSGNWSARPEGQLKATVIVSQPTAGDPISQKAVQA